MIQNAKRIPEGETIACDYCIVGAGAAGISLALELAKTDRSVVLLEAGGMNRAGRSLDLYRGTLADPERHLPLDKDRYRQLGGTTAIWGGRCIPFDPIDFEPRPYVPHSGWPFGASELEPFYRRAHEYCECGAYAYRAAEALPDAPREMIGGFHDGELVTDTIERWSPPTHFGKRYKAVMKSLTNLRVLVNAVCMELVTGADGRRVAHVAVSTFRRNTFRVSPRATILAGGGMEVTRLLLASRRTHALGIGNHSDWLGRCYMCHLSGAIARVQFPAGVPVISGYEQDADGVYCRRRLWIDGAAQRRHGLLNTHLMLDRPLISDPSHGSGILSLAFLAKNMVQGKRHLEPGRGKYALYWAHARNILSGSPEIMSFLPKFCRRRFVQGRRIPSLLMQSKSNSYYLYYHSEQSPHRDSRLSVSSERDAFGVPRLHLDYRMADGDVESVLHVHELIDRELRKGGCGQLVFNEEDVRAGIRRNQAVLGHHIGTTRMSVRPEDGVVDPDCRVHGVDNLYVASSSVFPTSSQANPTLTIVAMALRLADRLKASPGRG